MRKQKLVYIISNTSKALLFERVAIALRNEYDLTFILINPDDSCLEQFLKKNDINHKRITYRGKQDIPSAFIKILAYLATKRPQIVHAHLLIAQLLGLSASYILGTKLRIYTRHHSDYHHIYFPHAVRYDVWSNNLATKIASVSQATDHALLTLEKVSPRKVVKVPHGIEVEMFKDIALDRVKAIKHKWKIQTGGPVIGMIARLEELKGIQYVVPAFKRYLDYYPDACLVVANAKGPYLHSLQILFDNIPQENIVLIPFETDVAALYKVFTFYVHVPVNETCEAFGQTYLEALAVGIPSIFTLSGVAKEFIIDLHNALIVNFKNSDEIYDALIKLSSNLNLQKGLSVNGKLSLKDRYELSTHISKLKQLYNYDPELHS